MKPSITERIEQLNWDSLAEHLHLHGYAKTGALLTPEECKAISEQYTNESLYRSRVVMARHGFGLGEYKYFTHHLRKLPTIGKRSWGLTSASQQR
jgi:uncharacterized protein